MSKGSKRRPTNETAFGNNFDSIFRKDSQRESPWEAPIVSEEEILRCKDRHCSAGYESCKETDTDRTRAAQDRALVNQ